MKILVAGGRDFNYKDIIDRVLSYEMIPYISSETTIITGGARGVDKIAHQWAKDYGCMTKVIDADWKQFGKKAGYIRNVEMANERPDLVILFPGGVGTNMMYDIAKKRGLNILDLRGNQ